MSKEKEINSSHGIIIGDQAIVWTAFKNYKALRYIKKIDKITTNRWGNKFWSNGIWYCYAQPLTDKNIKSYEQSNKDRLNNE